MHVWELTWFDLSDIWMQLVFLFFDMDLLIFSSSFIVLHVLVVLSYQLSSMVLNSFLVLLLYVSFSGA
ncbi:hypothetical protein GQ55_2G227200 [Panicum hallii var. hallii]|uniref:Uncharacterized protein n=1 Tax=Panicum hallii var. hallii TaxID=1504633 RepID=A0A2T7ERF8_9POAL|nr:hypothetical protein GQ55_2G227200 [Panicum hallii var. hallii]